MPPDPWRWIATMSSQLEQMSTLSRTVVDGLVQRMRKVGDLLALVSESSQLATHRAASDTVTTIGSVCNARINTTAFD